MRYVIVGLVLLVTPSCNNTAKIFEGFDSDMSLVFYVCTTDCSKVLSFDEGKTEFGFTGVKKFDGLYIDNLGDEEFFPMDSVIFIDMDSTFKYVFINPDSDDSVDFKAKADAHYWNRTNWSQGSWNENFYFIIRREIFDEFKEPL